MTPQLGASNTALWGAAQPADPNAERLIQATLTGLAISAVPRHPDQVSDVPLLALIYGEGNDDRIRLPVAGRRPALHGQLRDHRRRPGPSASTSAATTPPRLTTTDYVLSALADPWVAGNRTATLDELRRLGFTTSPGAEVRLSTMAKTALTDWPSAARIGSETFA